MKIKYVNYEPRDSRVEGEIWFGKIGEKSKLKDCAGNSLYYGDVIIPINGYGVAPAFLAGEDAFILTKRDEHLANEPLMKTDKGEYYYPSCCAKEDGFDDSRKYGDSYYRIKSYKQLVIGEKWGLHYGGFNDEAATIVEVVE